MKEANLKPFVLQTPVIIANPPRYGLKFTCPYPPLLGYPVKDPHLHHHYEDYLHESKGVGGDTTLLHTRAALEGELLEGYEFSDRSNSSLLTFTKTIALGLGQSGQKAVGATAEAPSLATKKQMKNCSNIQPPLLESLFSVSMMTQ